MRLLSYFSLFVVAVGAQTQAPNAAQTTSAAVLTLRSWAESYALANTTVANLTLAEKIGLVTGVGQFNSRCVGNVSPVARLGIPGFCLNDGPAGVRPTKGVTGFPPGIAAAATFSRRLMRARGVALGEEFRGKGIKCMRNPKAGRGWESFGPDPYLNGEAAFETITGIQSVGVMACAKHFIANNQEHWRYGLIADVDDRTLHEMYYYPFLRSIEANVSAVMCAYNQFNGTSSCHNAALIGPKGLLRRDGFQGFVVSDWGATHDSAADNANAGLDMEQPGDWILIGGGVFNGVLGIGSLQSDVNSGSVPLARLNEMVTRILAPWYRLGQDTGYPAVNFDAQHSDGSGTNNLNIVVRSDAHTALSREIAAASADALIPNLDCGDLNECDDGTMEIGSVGLGFELARFHGAPITALNQTFVGTAKAAHGQDVAIVLVNAMSGELGFYNSVNGNEGDRNDLELWYDGSTLVEGVAAVCSNTIVVVHSIGPVHMPWTTNPNITAIVYAGAPGEQTGPGLVDVLFGAVNFQGRLPFSIADLETSYGTTIVTDPGFPIGFPTINYTERLLLDYRYMDAHAIAPRFEYGFGLSYTTFAYSGLTIKVSGTSQVISFTVKNTGAPLKVLRGFDEVPLAAGAISSIWDTPSQSWVRPPGTFTVFVGASSRDIRLNGSF
ncbi:glycoside hydrolase family 3 protein [Mycena leptocephala]|nr:glycoside hydrolase family 3 protein [Mycena leptocephala]